MGQSMEYHNTVTTSRTHAVQFLTSLMDSQPQFTQLIKLIQQQLKQRRAQGGDPANAAHNIISGAPPGQIQGGNSNIGLQGLNSGNSGGNTGNNNMRNNNNINNAEDERMSNDGSERRKSSK